MSIINTISDSYRNFSVIVNRYISDIVALSMRLLLAKVFLSSGLLKWNGWFDFNEQTIELFKYEFFCPDPVREGALQLCNPQTLEYEQGSLTLKLVEWLAIGAGLSEVLLPALLILGLFTRLGAIGLAGMTLFIQLAVFPEWSHWWNPAAWWMVVALGIAAYGPGRISLDHFLNMDRVQSERQEISSNV